MNNLIYLTGEQGSGKSTLCGLIRKAIEVNSLDIVNIHEIDEKILKNWLFHETIIYTSQVRNIFTEKHLNSVAEKHKLKFHSIHLKNSK